jgi:hypothetical protein
MPSSTPVCSPPEKSRRHEICCEPRSLPSGTIYTTMVGFGILYGLVILLGGLLFAFGLMGDQKLLIGLGLLTLALCAIFGVQPDWPIKRRTE